MIFGRKINKIIFNGLDNCNIVLVNNDLNSKKIKSLKKDFNCSKNGKVLSLVRKHPEGIDPFRNFKNIEIPVDSIEHVEFNNCNIRLLFGASFDLESKPEMLKLKAKLHFKNSKIDFGKLFQKLLTVEVISSDVSMQNGSSFESLYLKILKDSSLHIDNSFIDNLNLSLGDEDSKNDNSMFEMHKRAFSKEVDLKIKSDTIAYLNILDKTKILSSELNFNHLKINGNSEIKLYKKDQYNSLIYLEGNNDYQHLMNDIVLGKIELLKIYRTDYSDWSFARTDSKKENKLIYPAFLQLSLCENKKNKEYEIELKRLEVRLKEENLNISPIDFMKRINDVNMSSEDSKIINSLKTLKEKSEREILIMKEENEVKEAKLLEKKVENTIRRSEIEAIESENRRKKREEQAEIAMKKAEAERAGSESSKLDKTLYYKKLFNVLNSSCPTDNINIENKGYVISALKKTFSDKVVLTPEQKKNRNKLCILYDIKQTKSEVVF